MIVQDCVGLTPDTQLRCFTHTHHQSQARVVCSSRVRPRLAHSTLKRMSLYPMVSCDLLAWFDLASHASVRLD